MAILAASMRVGTAVPPGKTLKLPTDGQRTRVEIDVLPPEPKRLTLTKSQGQGDAPPSAVSLRRSQPDDAERFIESQRLNLVLAGSGRVKW
jgi:hypothetical protein